MANTNEKERMRKTDIKKGVVNQKMVSFRCDIDCIEWLMSKPNKGRYINELIKADMCKQE